MRYEDLLHVVHAAASISGEEEIVVIGSQSILSSYPELAANRERDWEFGRAAWRAELLDAGILRERGETLPLARNCARSSATASRQWCAPAAETSPSLLMRATI